jgi:nicotinamidase-related amidase
MDASYGSEDQMTKALVIIDVQKAMFEDSGLQPADGVAVVSRIAGLIATARKLGAPVFFVQHDGGPDDSFGAGKPGFAFVDALTPAPGDDVTVKTKSSAFHSTDFDAKLKHAGVDHLVVTGMQSEYCVTSAIRGAYERGYRITLVSDAHTTLDTKVADGRTIAAIVNDTTRGSFGNVVPAAAIRFV